MIAPASESQGNVPDNTVSAVGGIPKMLVSLPGDQRRHLYDANANFQAGEQSKDLVGLLAAGVGVGGLGLLLAKQLRAARNNEFKDPITGKPRTVKAAGVDVNLGAVPTKLPDPLTIGINSVERLLGGAGKNPSSLGVMGPTHSKFVLPLALGIPAIGWGGYALAKQIAKAYPHKSNNEKALEAYTNEYEQLLNQELASKQAAAYKYSTVQFNLPDEASEEIKKLASKIPNWALTDRGREKEPHVTVKYGLHTEDPDEVRELIGDMSPFTVKLGSISVFESDEYDEYDVVKVEVTGSRLRNVSKKLASELDHSDKHKVYRPHVTIAYVKKGMGEKYARDLSVNSKELTVDTLTFNDKDGNSTEIKLEGVKSAMTRVNAFIDALEENWEGVKQADFYTATLPAIAGGIALGTAYPWYKQLSKLLPQAIDDKASEDAIKRYRTMYPSKSLVVSTDQPGAQVADMLDTDKTNVVPVVLPPHEEEPEREVTPFDLMGGTAKVARVQELLKRAADPTVKFKALKPIQPPKPIEIKPLVPDAKVTEKKANDLTPEILAQRIQALQQSNPKLIAQLIAQARAAHPATVGSLGADDSSIVGGLVGKLQSKSMFGVPARAVQSGIMRQVSAMPQGSPVRMALEGQQQPAQPSAMQGVMRGVGAAARSISPIQYGIAAGLGGLGLATGRPAMGAIGAGTALAAKPIWNEGIKPLWDRYKGGLPSSNPALATPFTSMKKADFGRELLGGMAGGAVGGVIGAGKGVLNHSTGPKPSPLGGMGAMARGGLAGGKVGAGIGANLMKRPPVLAPKLPQLASSKGVTVTGSGS